MSSTDRWIASAGGIGGAASNLLYLAQQLTAMKTTELSVVYLLGTIIYFALGALIAALVFQETDRKKAFFLGIGLPALIAAAISAREPLSGGKLPTESPSKAASFLKTLDLIPTAFAQEARTPVVSQKSAIGSTAIPQATPPAPAQPQTPPSAKADGGAEIITFTPHASVKGLGDYRIWFFDSKGDIVGSNQIISTGDQRPVIVQVPASAQKFGIWNDKVTARVWELPKQASGEIKLDLTPKRTYSNDFWRAIGSRHLKPYELFIEDKTRANGAPAPGK